MKKWFLFCTLIFIFFITGCSSQDSAKTSGPSEEMLASLTADAAQIDVVLPDFVANSPAIVKESYSLAYANQDILEFMPCFCGCVNAGHESNKDCYIKDMRENGAVVWDNMSATWDICINIARDAIAMKKEGKKLIDIRHYIDETYGHYGPSTKTPMPPEGI